MQAQVDSCRATVAVSESQPAGRNTVAVLRIKQANCKNCYKCVRICPVKAIKIQDGQATVDGERCIVCGRCWRACPQQAKEVASDRQAVNNLLQGTAPVYVSLAPALTAAWPNATPGQLVTALLRLGFAGVSQTAAGAAVVNQGYQRLLERPGTVKPLLTTACPAAVNLVETYYPALVSHLAPLPSPLIVHARLLKQSHPGAKVVFVGPCLAKKAEVLRPEYAGVVDGVLLYSEVSRWMQEAAISPGELPETAWMQLDRSVAALYPESGGLLRHLRLQGRLATAVAGTDELLELLSGLADAGLESSLVECNACSGGCLNGPDMPLEEGLIKRLERVRQYHRQTRQAAPEPTGLPEWPEQLFSTDYRPRPLPHHDCAEAEITEVLRRIGKHSAEQELNCGACGYASCREKARAVLAGMAEPDMCMPYMRSRAESLANQVMQSTPNALIVVDRALHVQEFNPAAEHLLQRRAEAIKGQPVSLVMPDEDFRSVRDHGQSIVGKKVAYPQMGLITVQTTIMLTEDANLLLAVLTDITRMEKQAEELAVVKAETVIKAQEVIDKQMRVAQEIAGLLGEVTADSKMLLMRLIRLVQGEGEVG